MENRQKKSLVMTAILVLLGIIFLPIWLIIFGVKFYKSGKISKVIRNIMIGAGVAIFLLGVIQISGEKKGGKEADTPYENLLCTLQERIDENNAESETDLEELQSDYELLLSLYINEYFFKSYAYGHFTGDFKASRFEDIAETAGDVSKSMKKYFPEESVDAFYMMCVKMAMNDFEQLNYDNLLIGSEKSPDVDAMWDSFIESTLGLAN